MKPGDTFTIIIGSADQQETERNPLSVSQRKEMLSIELEGYPVTISTINDSPYNYDLWIECLCAKMLGFKSATHEDFLEKQEDFILETNKFNCTNKTIETLSVTLPQALYGSFCSRYADNILYSSCARRVGYSGSSCQLVAQPAIT